MDGPSADSALETQPIRVLSSGDSQEQEPVLPRGPRARAIVLETSTDAVTLLQQLPTSEYEVEVLPTVSAIADSLDSSQSPGRGQLMLPVLLFLEHGDIIRLWENDQVRLRHLRRGFIGTIVLAASKSRRMPAADAAFPARIAELTLAEVSRPLEMNAIRRALHQGSRTLHLELERRQLKHELKTRQRELFAVTEVGRDLSGVRDLNVLLDKILRHARELTGADAGSLYLVEGEDRDLLRFTCAQNDSIKVSFQTFTMPLDTQSMAGYCAVNREIINIRDAYRLPTEAPFQHNRNWDEQAGYRTMSVLAAPLLNHRDEVVGVLQLINRKRDPGLRLANPPQDVPNEVISFDADCIDLLRSFAGQAAVAIDNSMLVHDIEELFEGLVRASVTAIESRDPTTSGHSQRVATLSVRLAEVVSSINVGMYTRTAFSADQLRELRYAGLLHDFGKVGVREKVLVKAKKLYPYDLDLVRQRFQFLMKDVEVRHLRGVIPHLAGASAQHAEFLLAATEAALREDWEQLLSYLDVIERANEPSVLAEAVGKHVTLLGDMEYSDPDGNTFPFLTQAEIHNLSIPRGTLNPEERQEIESHVSHTYKFLSLIPWTGDLRLLPEIAWAHHEKLNGEGYPNKLTEREIPVQSKIMAIADIFDALTAADRPYKKAVPVEKALDILDMEVNDDHLDAELVTMFREGRVFEATQTKA